MLSACGLPSFPSHTFHGSHRTRIIPCTGPRPIVQFNTYPITFSTRWFSSDTTNASTPPISDDSLLAKTLNHQKERQETQRTRHCLVFSLNATILVRLGCSLDPQEQLRVRVDRQLQHDIQREQSPFTEREFALHATLSNVVKK